MRHVASLAIFIALDGLASADDRPPEAGYTTIACMEVLPAYERSLVAARGRAAGMFARAGVKVQFRRSDRCPPGAVYISFSEHTPEQRKPGALAYAMPYEGTHIVVFLDRIAASVNIDRFDALLAHVLAHEITHILQGVTCHSDSGLMKARWGRREFQAMVNAPLPFTRADIQMIKQGIERRNTPLAATKSE
jgi:hypothetical protein